MLPRLFGGRAALGPSFQEEYASFCQLKVQIQKYYYREYESILWLNDPWSQASVALCVSRKAKRPRKDAKFKPQGISRWSSSLCSRGTTCPWKSPTQGSQMAALLKPCYFSNLGGWKPHNWPSAHCWPSTLFTAEGEEYSSLPGEKRGSSQADEKPPLA